MEIEGKRMTPITLYGPNKDTPDFYTKLSEMIETLNNPSVVITGEFNLVQNQSLNTYNYQNIYNPKAKGKVPDINDLCNLADTFREINPDLIQSTLRKDYPIKQAR